MTQRTSSVVLTPHDEKSSDVEKAARGLWHFYPTRIFYGTEPLVGEKALCGHVKRFRAPGRRASEVAVCIVCLELRRAINA